MTTTKKQRNGTGCRYHWHRLCTEVAAATTSRRAHTGCGEQHPDATAGGLSPHLCTDTWNVKDPFPEGGKRAERRKLPQTTKSEGSPTLTDPCATSLQDLREAGASATQAVARQWMVGHVPRTRPAAFPHCRKRVCPLCTPLPLPGPGGSRLRNQCLGNLTPWSEPGRAWRLTLQSRVGEQGGCCEPGGRTPAL